MAFLQFDQIESEHVGEIDEGIVSCDGDEIR